MAHTKKAWFKVAEDSGWHCSWCFKAEGILKKMQDAPRSDYPRWGDFPGIANITFIQGAIRDGLFFDRSPIRGKWKKRQREVSQDLDPQFAPQFVIDNKDKFGYLLENPYKKTKHTTSTTVATTKVTTATTARTPATHVNSNNNTTASTWSLMKILKHSFLAGVIYQQFMT